MIAQNISVMIGASLVKIKYINNDKLTIYIDERFDLPKIANSI